MNMQSSKLSKEKLALNKITKIGKGYKPGELTITQLTSNVIRNNIIGKEVVASNNDSNTGRRVKTSTPLPSSSGLQNHKFFSPRSTPILKPAIITSLSSKTFPNMQTFGKTSKQFSIPSVALDQKRKFIYGSSQASTSGSSVLNNLGKGKVVRRPMISSNSGHSTKRARTSSKQILEKADQSSARCLKKPEPNDEISLCPLCPNSKEYPKIESVMKHLRQVHKLVGLDDTKPVEVANLVKSLVEKAAKENEEQNVVVTSATGDNKSSVLEEQNVVVVSAIVDNEPSVLHVMKNAESTSDSYKSTSETTLPQSWNSKQDQISIVPITEGIENVQKMLQSRKSEVSVKFQKLLDNCLTKEDLDMIEDSLDSVALHL